MTIAILGASGFIGTHLTKSLLINKHKLILFSKNKLSVDPANGATYSGDFGDSKSLEKVFSHSPIDVVVHLISSLVPSSSYDEYQRSLTSDLLGTSHLLKLMSQYKCHKLVYVSSGGAVYGNQQANKYRENIVCDPINYYGLSKLQIEKLIQTFSKTHRLNYIITRPSNAYGPGQISHNAQGLIAAAFEAAKQNKPLTIYGDGSVQRDFLYIGDLIESLVQLIETSHIPNEIINIAQGKTHTISEVISIVENVVGKKIKIQHKPDRDVDVKITSLSTSKLHHLLPNFEFLSLSKGIQKTYSLNNQTQ